MWMEYPSVAKPPLWRTRRRVRPLRVTRVMKLTQRTLGYGHFYVLETRPDEYFCYGSKRKFAFFNRRVSLNFLVLWSYQGLRRALGKSRDRWTPLSAGSENWLKKATEKLSTERPRRPWPTCHRRIGSYQPRSTGVRSATFWSRDGISPLWTISIKCILKAVTSPRKTKITSTQTSKEWLSGNRNSSHEELQLLSSKEYVIRPRGHTLRFLAFFDPPPCPP